MMAMTVILGMNAIAFTPKDDVRAFSSEVDAGSREENASK